MEHPLIELLKSLQESVRDNAEDHSRTHKVMVQMGKAISGLGATGIVAAEVSISVLNELRRQGLFSDDALRHLIERLQSYPSSAEGKEQLDGLIQRIEGG